MEQKSSTFELPVSDSQELVVGENAGIEQVPAGEVYKAQVDVLEAYQDSSADNRQTNNAIPESQEVKAYRCREAARLGSYIIDFRDLEQIKSTHTKLGR